MTEKRFTITQDFEEHYRQIRDNGHIIMGCFLEAQAEPIVKLLNELHEENKELQGKYNAQRRLFGQLNSDYNNYRLSAEDCQKQLKEENEQLKAQLLYDGDGVCNICKHQYLVETGKYYVAKCEKEHEECSKVDLQYCEDFELVRDYE